MLQWPAPSPETHEDLFVRRYEQLLGRALQLTGRDAERSEDLVHEAFVQFVLGRPPLDAIRNVDAYLYGMLRNLRVSQARRAARGPIAWLSAVDYDSVDVVLRHGDIAGQLQIQDELVALLRFACARKRASKSGSVLLLRFFHGYYPEEIARLLCGPVRAVDDWLRLARREARQALESPSADADRALEVRRSAHPADDFILALRAAIFTAADGRCDVDALTRQYRPPSSSTMPTLLLAHIVSCRSCLERANVMLGLGPLRERYPTDSLGPSGRTPPSIGGGSPTDRGRRAGERRLRDVLSHRPKELRISTNGFLVGSHTIAAPRTDQTLVVNIPEPVGFVEVFSEQGVRLAMLPIDPPPNGDVEQQLTVDLDEGRSLAIEVSFGDSWPTVRTTYHDPSAIAVAAESKPPPAPAPAPDTERALVPAWRRMLSALGDLFVGRPWRVAATCAAVALLALTVSMWPRRPIPSVTGDVLLARAAMVEQAADTAAPIVHRTVLLEAGGTDPRARQRLEIWRDTAGRRVARRLFDADGRLVAGEWVAPDGATIVYARDTTPRLRRFDRGQAWTVTGDDVWRVASAVDLAPVLALARRATVSEAPGAYVVALDEVSRTDTPWLAGAELRIRKSDSHLIEGRLRVRRAAGEVEYRLVETGFRRVASSAAPERVFSVDPDLESNATPSAPSLPAANIPVRSPLAAILVELAAVQRLHDAGACLGEQITVARAQDGVVRVEGVVDDDARRRELMSALEPLRAESGVELRIASASRSARRTGGPNAARHIDVGPGQMPAHDALSQYFSSQGSAAQVEGSIRSFAERTLETSRRALLGAWALKRLTDQFRPDVLRAIGHEPYSQWAGLVADHAARAHADLVALRQTLAPITGRDVADFPSTAIAGGEIWAAADRLLALATTLDGDLRSALAVSEAATPGAALSSDGLWQALERALTLTQALRHAS